MNRFHKSDSAKKKKIWSIWWNCEASSVSAVASGYVTKNQELSAEMQAVPTQSK